MTAFALGTVLGVILGSIMTFLFLFWLVPASEHSWETRDDPHRRG